MPADAPLKPYKKEFGYSYSFGVFPTLELVQHRPDEVIRVLVSEAGLKNKGVSKLNELCDRRRIPFELNARAVERLSPKENAYVVGVFRKYEPELSAEADHVLLVSPADMGNLGTIMRTMLGFGVTNLGLVRPAADLFDPRAVRASMGALFSLNFHYFDTYEQYHDLFSQTDRALFPFMTGGTHSLSATRFDHPLTLIFGNESSGLPPQFSQIGHPVTIPHTDKIDSLSLPIAVALGLYAARQDEA
ncbi:MAG TPA: TrmH family RNA methyltransferase [Chloroflexia bacterium]|nr:TrmH family RNA methyltransferase [Chloroflexia bacterium]